MMAPAAAPSRRSSRLLLEPSYQAGARQPPASSPLHMRISSLVRGGAQMHACKEPPGFLSNAALKQARPRFQVAYRFEEAFPFVLPN